MPSLVTTQSAEPDAPTLSVVVPTHQVGDYIDECLRSIQRQCVSSMEVIVVDDHSTDSTIDRVAEFAQNDPRYRLMRSDDRGGAIARNRGAAAARGRYLIFIDGDDIVPDGAFTALIDSLESTGSDIACGRYLKFSATRTWDPTRSWPVYKNRLARVTLDEHPALVRGRPCWNKLFRRTFWNELELEFPNVVRSNDILPITTALAQASAIDVLPDVVYLYRERPGTQSMTSRAGRGASLLSYLQQETACLAVLAEHSSRRTMRVYWDLLYQADLWVHLARFVPQADDENDREILPLIAALVTDFIRRTPSHAWARVPLARRRYLEIVAANEFGMLAGLDHYGEIAPPAVLGATALRVFGRTIDRLTVETPAFDGIIARGVRRALAAPLPANAELDLEQIATELRAVGESLTRSVTLSLGPQETHLLRVAAEGDIGGLHRLLDIRTRAVPTGAVRANYENAFELDLDLESDAFAGVNEVRVIGRHRDTGLERAATWHAIPGGQTAVTLPFETRSWNRNGVWLLEIELRTPDIDFRRPVATAGAAPLTPADRRHRLRFSPAKRAGHQLVAVREPAVVHRLSIRAADRFRRTTRELFSRFG